MLYLNLLKEEKRRELEPRGPIKDKYQRIHLRLNVPSGKLSDIVKIVNFIKSKFNKVNINVEVSAQDGEISISDYEDKIKEGIEQANVNVEEEKWS